VAVSVDPTHGEALNNIAVLEMRRQKFEVAKSCLSTSCEVSPHIFEPFYNSGNHFLESSCDVASSWECCAQSPQSNRLAFSANLSHFHGLNQTSSASQTVQR